MEGEHKGRNWHLFKKGHRESDLTAWEKKGRASSTAMVLLSLISHLSKPHSFAWHSCSSSLPSYLLLAVWSTVFPMYLFILAAFSTINCFISFNLLPTNTHHCIFSNSPSELHDCEMPWFGVLDCLQARVTLHEPYAVTGCFSALGLPSHSHRFMWEAFLNSWFLFPQFLPSFREFSLSY